MVLNILVCSLMFSIRYLVFCPFIGKLTCAASSLALLSSIPTFTLSVQEVLSLPKSKVMIFLAGHHWLIFVWMENHIWFRQNLPLSLWRNPKGVNVSPRWTPASIWKGLATLSRDIYIAAVLSYVSGVGFRESWIHLDHGVWCCRHLCRRMKVWVFRSLVLPILLYGCET